MNRWNRPGIRLSLLGLLFTAAVASSTLAATMTPIGTYSSTIVDWPKGKTGTVNLVDNNHPGSLASAPIDADGHFIIKLPDQKTVNLDLAKVSELFLPVSNLGPKEDGCVGQGTATPANAQLKGFDLTASIAGGEPIDLKLKSDTHEPYAVGQGLGELQYFDMPTTLDGNVTCVRGSSSLSLKGTFPAGWSIASGTLTAVSSEAVETHKLTSDPLPSNVTWHLYDLVSGIGVQVDPVTPGQPGVKVTSVRPGLPAELAGVQANDLIVEIDGKDVTALPLVQELALVRGPVNTAVTLGVKRGSETTIRRFKIVRVEIKVP